METPLKLEKATIAILAHFGSIAKSIHIRPSSPQTLCCARDDKLLLARARNVQEFEKEMPIYEISNFVSALTLFRDTDFHMEIHRDRVEIVSDDGVFNQNFMLSDPDILLVPKEDKVNVYFESEVPVEFDLTAQFQEKLIAGITQNTASSVLFENQDGMIVARAADVNNDGRIEKTANQFSLKTGSSSDVEFRVGVPAAFFKQTSKGNYKVGVTKNFIRLTAPADAHVDYIIPSQRWSTLGA